ncbi:Uncharacterised protein [uncultured archaeon]|nr:Uncharacterised protein [uncultured archaeon]
MAREKLLGLLVVPADTNSVHSGGIAFDCFIARRSHADPMFFTNPKLRAALGEIVRMAPVSNPGFGEIIEGKRRTGYVSYDFLRSEADGRNGQVKSRNVYESRVYPFYNFQFSPALFHLVVSIGAGRGLEKIAVREFRRLAGNSLIVPAMDSISEYRRRQLRDYGVRYAVGSRGEDVGTFKVGARHLNDQILASIRRYRKAHRVRKSPPWPTKEKGRLP